MQLSFDRIKMPNGPTSKFGAQVIEVIPNGASEGVDKVDSEGGVKGKNSTRGDVEKVGAATGVGAIIGAIAGGGVGAAIGASIGAVPPSSESHSEVPPHAAQNVSVQQ